MSDSSADRVPSASSAAEALAQLCCVASPEAVAGVRGIAGRSRQERAGACAQSDLLADRGAELFQMCAAVFRPQPVRLERLAAHVSAWTELHTGDLRNNEVLEALPSSVRRSVMTGAAPRSPGETLRRALAAAKGTPEELALVRQLYAAVAPLVWPFLHRAKSTALESAA